ncbi:23S rRNA (uracil(747)-C(5))-methyltransferase RlmC [Ruania albidiflava]|uniref:23S rRNA (uracil(747)-C(5))-methyltransferase RlmC n=1 Tax=Ruania albidiflava TaxID=366586 RepID=UPI0003B72600|nr:23S rRNA (uracil(747)-C(5))-methyltransferase RlmC [Ruania albidiflava]
MHCGYYDSHRCRSCTLIETRYAVQLADKDSRARAVVAAAAGADLDWAAPVASAESGFRNKAKMVVGGTVAHPTLGILGPGRAGVDLRGCSLHEEPIVAALTRLSEFITTAQLTPYQVSSRRGELKYVLVTASPTGELMVRFVLRSTEALPRIRKHLRALRAALPQLVVASVNLQPAPAAVIEGEQEILLTGSSALPLELNGLCLHLRPQSFFQTNTAVAAALYRQAVSWTRALPVRTVWDLYCGVGGFALHLAGPGRQVTGFEISAQAVASARCSAAQAGLEGQVSFAVGDATHLATRSGDVADLVVVNPPRRGIGEKLASHLEQSGVQHVLYSSCNVDSLGRDLARMRSLRPVRGQVLDMFPQTGHFETLVLLERR